MATISELFATALEHHRADRPQLAEQICRQILQIEPNQPDAIHLLGLIASRLGNYEVAIQCMKRSNQLKANQPDFLNDLGEAYRGARRIPDAEACYRRALQLQPGHVQSQINLWRVSDVLVMGVPQTQGLIPDSAANLISPAGGAALPQTGVKYRVCVVAPPGWAHYHCFREVALLLKYSLDSLGFDCDLTLNELARDRSNILLGYNHLTYTPALKDYHYIPYQLEQLSQNSSYYSDRSHQILANAAQVWDYAQENIAFLRSRGIEAKYLPIGYHPKLQIVPRDREKDVDILFFGAISQRRMEFFQRILNTTDLKLKLLFGVYGPQRDEWIARTRIIINVHQFPDMQVLESPRVGYLLNNQCFMICENTSMDPYAKVGLEFGDFQELIEKCRGFVAASQRREELAQEWHRRFKADYEMVELIKGVL